METCATQGISRPLFGLSRERRSERPRNPGGGPGRAQVSMEGRSAGLGCAGF